MSIQDKVIKQFWSKTKDKDLMSDTGGTTKKRPDEPSQKPPREDKMDPYRTKRKTPEERDPDTDNDPDLKKSYNVHPLDKKQDFAGFQVPDNNQHILVYNSLVHILAEERSISEKDFNNYKIIMQEADDIIRMPEITQFIENMKDKRPPLCAEIIWEEVK